MQRFVFSVVMPVHNVESYLEEAISSIVQQSVGFLDHIQLVLVDDGSTDGSLSICKKYAKKYPNNIIFLHQDNAGVSAARNAGLTLATGDYINFLDADDKWELDAFEKAHSFLKKNPEVGVLGARMRFFETRSDYHALDFKFDKDKVVDINEHYDHVQLSASSAFIKRELLRGLSFDTQLECSEDMKLVTQIISHEGRLGILASACYLYRRRLAKDSAISGSLNNPDWYRKTPRYAYSYLFKMSKKMFGEVIPYIQYIVMYDLQWRISTHSQILDLQEQKEYKRTIWELVRQIDDKIIMEQRFLPAELKNKIIELKHKDFANKLVWSKKENGYKYNKIVFNPEARVHVASFYEKKSGKISISGVVTTALPVNNIKLFARVDENIINIPLANSTTDVEIFDDLYPQFRRFRTELNVSHKLIFIIEYANHREVARLTCGEWCRMAPEFRIAYRGRRCIYFITEDSKINVRPNHLIGRARASFWRFATFARTGQWKAMLIRATAQATKILYRRKVWIISDRADIASDNGLVFYNYMLREHPEIKCYFAISKCSADFKKITPKKRRLEWGSMKHKLLYLTADRIISSQATTEDYNPLAGLPQYYDIVGKPLCFLQHGVIGNDISTYCNRYEKEIGLFVTSSKKERSSLLGEDYGFLDDEVVLTGLPRFDLLKDQKKKLVLLMPTWRSYFAKSFSSHTPPLKFNKNFRETDYYKFFNGLLNNPHLVKILRDKGHKLLFVPHPNIRINIAAFKNLDPTVIEFCDKDVNYTELFNSGSLLITDYSSVSFDFAYLKKPVIYTRFDEERVFTNHIKPGYFDAHKSGFGPVANSITELIKQIEKILTNDAVAPKKYKDRMERFFAYSDDQNCKRVFEAILKLRD